MDAVANDLVSDAKYHTHSFTLWPSRWQQFLLPGLILTWQDVPFDRSRTSEVPQQPGLYAFIIRPRTNSGLGPGYLMYIGEADDLRVRFLDYFREMGSDSGRPRVVLMLSSYQEHLDFRFACLPTSADPKTVEKALIETYVPPINKNYPASIRRVMGAF